jgi:hypothetical protein
LLTWPTYLETQAKKQLILVLFLLVWVRIKLQAELGVKQVYKLRSYLKQYHSKSAFLLKQLMDCCDE